MPHRMADGVAVLLDQRADGLSEVGPQVPAGRHLDRAGRTLPNTFRIGTRPIPGDDLHARMLAQPVRQGGGLPVGQQVDDIVALEIHQRGAVVMAPAPGPVIHSQHPRRRRWHGTSASGTGDPQQGVRADRHGEALRQACSSLTAERQASTALQVIKAPGPACRGRRNLAEPFGKGPPRAVRVEAAEPPRLDEQRHRPALPGQIAEAASVVAVNPARGHGTARTVGGPGAGLGEDADAISRGQGLVDQQTRRKKG